MRTSLKKPFKYYVLLVVETCGGDWKTMVTRRALSALGAGGGVVVVGSSAATLCSGVSLAARALHRPEPAKCSEPRARAAAVLQLARRLRWRRALLWLAGDGQRTGECSAALLDVERALLAAGLLVRRGPTDTAADTFRAHGNSLITTDTHIPLGIMSNTVIKMFSIFITKVCMTFFQVTRSFNYLNTF